jgi:hypothetical protein
VLLRFGELGPLGKGDVTLEGAHLRRDPRPARAARRAGLQRAARDHGRPELLRGFRRISVRSALTAALAVPLVPVLGRDARRLADGLGDPGPRRCRARSAPRAEQRRLLHPLAAGRLGAVRDPHRARRNGACLDPLAAGASGALRSSRTSTQSPVWVTAQTPPGSPACHFRSVNCHFDRGAIRIG